MKKIFLCITATVIFLTTTYCKGNQQSHLTATKEEISLDSVEKKEVYGYRFVITGDFDGDGKKEQLFEHYYSQRDNKETNKYDDRLDDYDEMVRIAIAKDVYVFLSSDNSKIDTLRITKGGQVFGISYLKNEGDLDGDEVSYVVDWADWSNLNIWNIMTYKNGKWQALYAFPISDWQLPALPCMTNKYGLFGTEGKFVIHENDTINSLIEKDLYNFEGLVRKIQTNKIQVIFMNDEAELDSMIVDLKKPNKKRIVN